MSLPMTPTVNFKTKTKTKTKKDRDKDKDKDKVLKRPNMCYIFEKLRVQFDTQASSAHHQCIISSSSVHHQRIISPSPVHHQRIISASSAHHQRIISASSAHHQTRPGQRTLQTRGPNSRTCVLVVYKAQKLTKKATIFLTFTNQYYYSRCKCHPAEKVIVQGKGTNI